MVANFANLVPIASEGIPLGTNDLATYSVGSPMWPTELCLVHKNGTRYNVLAGIIQSYEDPRAVGKDPGHVQKYNRTSLLTSNEAFVVASGTLMRLAKTANPTRSRPPLVQCPSVGQNASPIPLYRFDWRVSSDSSRSLAEIAIDARNGHVVSLSLTDPAFCDIAQERQIRGSVYTAEPRTNLPRPPLDRRRFAIPSTNEVQMGLSNCMRLCEKLGLRVAANMTLSGVSWERTYVYTNHLLSERVCQVHLISGASFEFIGSTAVSYQTDDACYVRAWDTKSGEEWQRFRGRVSRRWSDLARNLENDIAREFNVSKAALSRLRPVDAYGSPELGKEGIVRCVVRWLEGEEDKRLAGTGLEPGGVFSAEFDLQSGELKYISVYNPAVIGWMGFSTRQGDRVPDGGVNTKGSHSRSDGRTTGQN